MFGLELRLVQPVAFVEYRHEGLAVETLHERCQKIRVVAALGVFGIEDAEQHVRMSDGPFQRGDVAAEGHAVRVGCVDQAQPVRQTRARRGRDGRPNRRRVHA